MSEEFKECKGSHLKPSSLIQNYSPRPAGVCSCCGLGHFLYAKQSGLLVVGSHEDPNSVIERNQVFVDQFKKLIELIKEREEKLREIFCSVASPTVDSLECLDVLMDDLDYLNRIRVSVAAFLPSEYFTHNNKEKGS